jgi:hypothetical protein
VAVRVAAAGASRSRLPPPGEQMTHNPCEARFRVTGPKSASGRLGTLNAPGSADALRGVPAGSYVPAPLTARRRRNPGLADCPAVPAGPNL